MVSVQFNHESAILNQVCYRVDGTVQLNLLIIRRLGNVTLYWSDVKQLKRNENDVNNVNLKMDKKKSF